jgi:hypothetical protein
MTMPRIKLTADEYQELHSVQLGDESDEMPNEIDDAQYLARRDALIRKAEEAGDFGAVDAILAKYPHPAQLAEQERTRTKKEALREEIEARRPQTPEDREAFLRGLDEVPDGDKAALNAYLSQHGMNANDQEQVAAS